MSRREQVEQDKAHLGTAKGFDRVLSKQKRYIPDYRGFNSKCSKLAPNSLKQRIASQH